MPATATAPAPSPNVAYMLGQLMERTEGLPEMRETVARTEERVQALEEKFDKHDAEMRRLRSDNSKWQRTLAFAKGQWKTAAALAAILADHYWRKGH